MPRPIGRDEVRELSASGAVVAEVLPREEYDWAHLPGAIHLPLKGWDIGAVQHRLERDRPVILYCNDGL